MKTALWWRKLRDQRFLDRSGGRAANKGFMAPLLLALIVALSFSLEGCSEPVSPRKGDDASANPASVFVGVVTDVPLDVRVAAADQTESERLARTRTAIEQAVESELADSAGQVSLVYIPLGGQASDLPSSANAPLGEGGVSIDGTTRRISASMIKLVVLAEVLDEVACGVRMLDEQITFDQSDLVGGSGVMQAREPETTLPLREVARLMIAESDNTATNKLIDLLGMDAINTQAEKLGLAQTVLQRKMLDEVAASQGRENYTSAADVAILLGLIAQGSFVDAPMSVLALDFLKRQTDGEGIADGVPEGVAVAHKTGMLDGAEHDGAIVFAERPYVLVVMTEGLDSTRALSLVGSISRAVYEQSRG